MYFIRLFSWYNWQVEYISCVSLHNFALLPIPFVSMDLFELDGKVYVIIVDYYSRWIEIKMLNDQSSKVISTLKELFSTHGIPGLVISDNDPWFSADTFRQFTADYGFIHDTRSPRSERKKLLSDQVKY